MEKRASIPSSLRVQPHAQQQFNDELCYADEATFYASFIDQSTNDDSDLQLTPSNDMLTRSSLLTQGTLYRLSNNTADFENNLSQNEKTPTSKDDQLNALDALSRAKILLNK
jgi:hypothetical protein